MLELAWPWALGALLLAPLARRLLPPATATNETAVRFPRFEALRDLHTVSATNATNRGRAVTPWLIWLLLVLAAARPQWLGEALEIAQEGRDILLAIDLSRSMSQEDFEINGRPISRLEVVRGAARRFVERRRGDRLGLILFGERAYLQTPLTFDTDTVRATLQDTEIGLAGNATAIGDAIGLAVKRLRNSAGDQRVLILMTDGRNTAGAVEPDQAAELARQQGLRIYTIGLGADRRRRSSLLGMRHNTHSADLDEALLGRIAEITGGRYFRARDARGLEAIYRELDRLEPRPSDLELFRPVSELFHWPLATAFLLSLAMVLWRTGGAAWLGAFTRRSLGRGQAPG